MQSLLGDMPCLRYRRHSHDQNEDLKGLDGTMIDFSDPSSYRGINSDDLAIYVKLEQAHLNREIENVLGEGGTFSTHSTDEFVTA